MSILDPTLFSDLPTDGHSAFFIFEQRIREKILSQSNDEDWYAEQRYLTLLAAFVDEYGLGHELGIEITKILELSGAEFAKAFSAVELRVSYFSTRSQLRNARTEADSVSGVFVLSAAEKIKIQKYINEIRSILATADLSERKRDALTKRLSAFSEEVDRNRTKTEALFASYLGIKREAKEELKPALDKVERIINVLEKAVEAWEALPKPEERKRLPAPSSKDSQRLSDNPEDEIPF